MTRPKGAARRDEILAGTCDVVRERGFAQTRMSDVADRLGISPPLVVYHFGSKDALLAEAFAYASRNEMVDLDAIADSTDAPLDRLDALLVSGLGPSTRAAWALWIDSWGEALRSPVLRKTWRQLDDRWRAVLEEVVEQGMDAGVFVAGDAKEMAAVLAVLIDGFGVQVALSSSRRAVPLEQARKVALALLGVSAAQARR
jgi:AcrR family transcriptional regulator